MEKDSVGDDSGVSLDGSGVGANGGLEPQYADSEGDDAAVESEPPPEVEVDAEFELPHAGQRYVYAVNPESDTVAVIDATTLAIHTVPAGKQPRFLQTLAGQDSAIVLNVESNDATIIRTKDGASEYSNVSVRTGANAIAVAPDGRHAVVYFDSRYSDAGLTAGNFQDVTVLTLGEDDVSGTAMTVGYRPSAVSFDAGSSRAFVVTDNGVSLLDFASIDANGPGQAETVSMGDSIDDAGSDVSVSADGHYAVARHEGGRALRLVDLQGGLARDLDVVSLVEAALDSGASGTGGSGTGGTGTGGSGTGGTGTGGTGAGGSGTGGAGGGGTATTGGSAAVAATGGTAPVAATDLISDVDLSPDSRYVVAVVRYAGAVLRIPVPAGFDDPSLVELSFAATGRIGQVALSSDGTRGVLFTTADPLEERLTIVDFDAASDWLVVDLHKAVEQVALSDDGGTAFVVHQVTSGTPTESSSERQVDQSEGYSLVNLQTGFAKLEITPTAVGSFAVVPEAGSVFLTFASPAEVHRVGLADFVHKTIALASVPVAIGPVPASEKVFVSQEHTDGRITFIDWADSAASTVTGFELNSVIRETE